ncbi:hypothetical protein GWI33_021557 [Rhynchophorus ferrugineus]|uniref:Uncharacterized protein n=1 Tax=Rhynchophorus ferrugineus TaxID=354439 RepID=A0A834IP67_RHYFE|nr:hypothetical protein GWI33_021557 [Rhynchophorus ferrugineus]
MESGARKVLARDTRDRATSARKPKNESETGGRATATTLGGCVRVRRRVRGVGARRLSSPWSAAACGSRARDRMRDRGGRPERLALSLNGCLELTGDEHRLSWMGRVRRGAYSGSTSGTATFLNAVLNRFTLKTAQHFFLIINYHLVN